MLKVVEGESLFDSFFILSVSEDGIGFEKLCYNSQALTQIMLKRTENGTQVICGISAVIRVMP